MRASTGAAYACTDIRRLFERERQRLAAQSLEVRELTQDEASAVIGGAADLHLRLPAWLAAHAADEKADLERALRALDADDRR
jgi:hypothetical protein